MNIDRFYQRLWQQYLLITPQAGNILQLFQQKFGNINNDHVAFRTFDQSPVSIRDLEPVLQKLGYRHDQSYTFKEKHLNARSYLHKNKIQPRFFLSELRCSNMSVKVQYEIQRALTFLPNKIPDESFFSSGTQWSPISYENYLNICAESEYAAWLLVWGFRVNHFTISVNDLSGSPGIDDIARLLQDKGFELNQQGGVVKGEVSDCLQQISTLAEKQSATFEGGVNHKVPGCYYEFAMRYPDAFGVLFEGFVPASADRIFESTNRT